MLTTYGDDVKLTFKHNPLSFHADAHGAALAAMAAARQGHFWKYHDVLFANNKALKPDQLRKYAEDLGLDMAQFDKDIADPKLAMKVDNDQAASVALGATGTPAFFVNGVKLSGAKPFEDFKVEIDKQLAAAKELKAQGVAADKIARQLTLKSGDQATAFVKYIVDEGPAPKVAKKEAPKAKAEDTTTVWKVPVDTDKEFIKGPKYAPVTIVEFSDFECPFCSKVVPTYKKILETYPNEVRVLFRHTPLPFHKNAPLASQAAIEAGTQGKFWEMHDLLFENQKALQRADLDGYAKTLGLDMKKFAKALDSGKHQAQIDADMAAGEAVQASGTPNAFVNGRKLTGAKPFEDFKTVIDEEIAKAKALTDKGTSLEDLYDQLVKDGKLFNPLDAKVTAIAFDPTQPYQGNPSAGITIAEFSDFQ